MSFNGVWYFSLVLFNRGLLASDLLWFANHSRRKDGWMAEWDEGHERVMTSVKMG